MEGFYIIILIIQMICYGIVDYFKLRNGCLIILSIFLSLFLIILPIYFRVPEETNCCCYNAFKYFEIYWNIGVSIVLAAHLLYCFVLNRKSKI